MTQYSVVETSTFTIEVREGRSDLPKAQQTWLGERSLDDLVKLEEVVVYELD